MQDSRLTARQALAEVQQPADVQSSDPRHSGSVKGEVNYVKLIHMLGLFALVLPLQMQMLLLCCRLLHRSQDSSS